MEKKNKKMDIKRVLPADCISKILSFTAPKDACRLSLASSAFKDAADSDALWESFLPSDCKDIMAQSSSPTLNSLHNKQLYFHLCDHPVLLPNKHMSFALEKESGKKCYMVGARGLEIFGGDYSWSWKWTSIPESRFPQVAEFDMASWLQIEGRIETILLSPKTKYAVFLLYKFGISKQGFRYRKMELKISYGGSTNSLIKRVSLDPSVNGPQQREDGWIEVEMGEFFNELGDDDSVVCEVCDWEFEEGSIMRGLVVEGIEFRPKSG